MERSYFKIDLIPLRLIYLWACVESGLGGLMHLFHIPLTGFIIGGFSILINVLLAKYTKLHIRTMLTGLGLVLLVKFALSPQSPIGAYIAVAFQGVLGILIFRVFTLNRFTIAAYSVIVMVENAIQKPLMAYIILGKELSTELWISITHFFQTITHFETFWMGLILLYFLIYIAWGLLVGVWTNAMKDQLDVYRLPADFEWKPTELPSTKPASSRQSYWKTGLGMLVLIAGILIYKYEIIPSHYLIRPFLFILFFGLVLPFLFRILLKYYQSKNTTRISEILSQQERIQNNFTLSFQYSKKYNGYRRWKEFVFLAIYLTLFQE